MTIGNFSSSSLLAISDLIYPPTGTIGHAILLKNTLTSVGITVNASTDVLTTSVAHDLVTGSRVRIGSTSAIPSPLAAASDYFAIVTAANTIKLAATLADALANIAVDLTDSGTGTLTLNEQALSEIDPISVLIKKELPATGGYARMPLTSVGAPTLVSGIARKITTVTLTATAAIEYRMLVVAIGANNTVGSTAGITKYGVVVEPTALSTAPGQTRAITINLDVEP